MKKIKNLHPLYLLSGLMAFFAGLPLARAEEAHTLGQPYPWEMTLQGSASPVRDQVEAFHDNILLPVITVIVAFVFALMFWIIVRYNAKANPVPSKTTHNTMLEIVWTLVPIIILATIAVPSLKLLYFADKTTDAGLTVKVTGYQWYWGYEYPDLGDVSFMSNYIHDADLKPGELRLLSTDNALVVPVNTNVRVLVTSSDVIHSWSVPAFGVKLDAVPGRTNETWFRAEKEGTFYGQCSQLCGAGHAYMPIEVKAVSQEDFVKFIHAQGGKMPSEVAAAKGAAQAAEVKADAKATDAKTEAKPETKTETETKKDAATGAEATKAVKEAAPKKAGE